MSASNSRQFNKCIFITNPGSTNQRRAKRLAKSLRQQYFDEKQFETIELNPKNSASFNKKFTALLKTLDDKSLICIGGGDGTVSMVVNKLLTTPGLSAKARQAVIFPLWGGNANDLAYMINGSAYRASVRKIMSQAKVVPVHPLEFVMKSKATDTRLATNYISIGVSAHAVKRVNNLSEQRTFHRLFYETSSVIRAIIGTKPFKTETGGTITPLYDLFLVNGSRMAKVAYRTPHHLAEKAFLELPVKRKLFYFTRLLKGLIMQRHSKTSLSMKLHDPTTAQIDGEVIQLPANTSITIKIHKLPFYTLSTKLK